MDEDGTLHALYEDNVTALRSNDEPVPVALPGVEGGTKIKVGVSGDLPPMDYITANGTPAGFNTAVIAELARRENLEVELVQVDSGARFAALASGRIDVFFWQTRLSNLTEEIYAGDVANYKAIEDESISCLTTIPYHTVYGGWLVKAQ